MRGFDHAKSLGSDANAYARHRSSYPDARFDWRALVAPDGEPRAVHMPLAMRAFRA